MVEHRDRIVAAVMTVHHAPWDDTPDCPFVIEVFTARSHRRRGLARVGLTHSLTTARNTGEARVALRVATANTPARRLYQTLGFTPRTPPGRATS